MKILAIVILLVAAMIGVLFSVLNSDTVMLKYYFGSLELPLSLALVSALAAGVLLGVLSALCMVLELRSENTKLKKEIRIVEKEVSNLRRLPLKDMN